jgi:hypothetical protein
MREWMLEKKLATANELDDLEALENQEVLEAREKAWQALRRPIEEERQEMLRITESLASRSRQEEKIRELARALKVAAAPLRRPVMAAVTEALLLAKDDPESSTAELRQWKKDQDKVNRRRYSSDLYSESAESALNVPVVPAVYSSDPPLLKGFEVIKACFDAAFARTSNLVAMGEDVGLLGGVNQGWAHLQERYGPQRITDTGIREATIVGEAIGMALRGLRPIAEIQYLTIFYALQHLRRSGQPPLEDARGQKAPVIISTRGHSSKASAFRSPMAGIINLVRGIYVCVPRNPFRRPGFTTRCFPMTPPSSWKF